MIRAPYWHDAPSALYVGDAGAVLADLPDGSADCIVTSPPYWGKRDYGVVGQYGHEPSPAAYVDTLRPVFAEARRVLADDGSCWLNLGDSYSAGGGAATGMHAYLGRHLNAHKAPGMRAKKPARPAVAGRVFPAGRRLDPAERDRVAQAERDARIGPRPAQLPA
jgi:site-specific DNA-methyltransferase (cytosine-N4-specific)